MDPSEMTTILREMQARDAYCLDRSVVRTFECSECAKECFEVRENPDKNSEDGGEGNPSEEQGSNTSSCVAVIKVI